MEIVYKSDTLPSADQVIELFDRSGLIRPTKDKNRIQKMLENADLIVTAWDKDNLIGISRCITDWVWCCYLSDLAVDPDYKKSGIGRKLINVTREKVGEMAMILLLSVPTAMDYYPKVGFTKDERAFSINRTK